MRGWLNGDPKQLDLLARATTVAETFIFNDWPLMRCRRKQKIAGLRTTFLDGWEKPKALVI